MDATSQTPDALNTAGVGMRLGGHLEREQWLLRLERLQLVNRLNNGDEQSREEEEHNGTGTQHNILSLELGTIIT